MPTDEQLREQFEEFVREQTVNRNPGGPWPTPTELAWLAWQARDAEVQALREALEKIVELSRKPLTGGFEFALAFTAAEKVARAALRGEEGTDHE